MHHFGEELHEPALIWWTVTGVGIVTAALLWVYDRFARTGSSAATEA